MKKNLDARGKSCPIPVIETKKMLGTLKAGDVLEVTVDNYIAVQNLCKMAAQKNIPVSSEKIDENNYLVIFSETGENIGEVENLPEEELCIPNRIDRTVVVIASEKMGEGDEKLGTALMKGFVYALTEQDKLPAVVLLYNNGAKLSIRGSESLADLKLLESQGVEILTCGTCLNHYGLSEELAVGTATNMYVITEKQMQATKLVKP